MIKFLLNNEEHLIQDVDPNTSVLDYLREHLLRTGTKEGCASGDCGACTVVLGELDGSKIKYSAANSCIAPLGSLHGKQLITVEDLKNGDTLHPVQQAIVDCHGSQCGFCTPGFVMSMFAYRKTNAQPDRNSINEALGGNLCRCTGYRPIIDAAVQMYVPGLDDQFSAREAETITALTRINADDAEIELEGNGKKYFAPSNVQVLADLLLHYPQAKLIVGGTDLSLEFTQFLREFEVLIYTGRVKELLEVKESADNIEIGAAVSYTDCKDILIAQYPDLHELIDRLGSRQIRNQGTLGGNIGNASPIGDMPPALIALDAQLVLRKGGARRTIPVADYFISYKKTAQQPAEFIERIIVPKAKPGYLFKAYKISKRLEDDITATLGVFHVKLENGTVADARIAFGGMAEIPRRATHCELALQGQTWSQETIAAAMAVLTDDFSPISDFRASADYRMQTSQNLLQRLYLETQSQSRQVRVTHYA
ncbi:MAG: xanthine dehydrogenase small subunit [Pseudomonadales bacterium]